MGGRFIMGASAAVRRWLVAAFGLALIVAALPQASYAAGPTGTIAYVRGNNATGDEIWLVQPDGSGDHRIYTTGRADPNDLLRIQSLAWKSDAAEIAFDSNHEYDCSLYQSDIFAVRADGSGYRRVTQAPDCVALAGYPQGSVTVPVHNLSSNAGVFFIYIQGARTVKQIGLDGGASGQVIFEQVADLGDRVQFAVGINGTTRYLGFGLAGVDVKANQSVTASPELGVGGQGFLDFGVSWPTWRLTGDKIAYKFGAGTTRWLPANPAPIANENTLLAPNADALFVADHLKYGPTPARANQVLYLGWDGFSDKGIYLVDEGASDAGRKLISLACCNEFTGLSWLPDGSGFVYSATEGDFLNDKLRGNIFEYDFATNQIKRLTDFPDGYTYNLAVSLDGSQIVYERTQVYGQGQVDLWMVNGDGSNAHLFKQNASAPAWSTADVPSPGPKHTLYLPIIMR